VNAPVPVFPRILVVANDRDYFLRHRLAVVDRLVGHGAAVTVAAGGTSGTPDEARGWDFVHVPLDRLSLGISGNLRLFGALLALMRERRPSTVHLITLKPAVFGGIAALLMRRRNGGQPARMLITIPGLGRLMSPDGHGAGRLSRPVRYLVGRVVTAIGARPGVHFTFETRHDLEVWRREGIVRDDNASVINGAGVDLARYFPRPGPRPAGPLRVLFASRLLRAKGLDVFVGAARLLAHRRDIEFVVAGWGDDADPDNYAPEDLAREPAIAFLGQVDDMPALLRSADIVCLPTRYGEGVPRILIEAAACGLPCIATDIDGCRAIIGHGESGVLLPVDDVAGAPAAIAAAVVDYAGDPALRAAHAAAARRRCVEHGFDEESVASAFLRLLVGAEPAQSRMPQ
jgi:glycosyltransferase involved in cell wall biosynthesis